MISREVAGEGDDGGNEGDMSGHIKMAAALSHLLSEPTAKRDKKSISRKRFRDKSHRDIQTNRDKIGSNFQSEESPQNDNDDGGNVIAGCRRLPDVSCLEHERKLQRIATTGEIESKMKAAGHSERKKAKVLSTIDKSSFIDLLKGQRSKEKSSKWNVLKEDYMMGARIRDWEKKEEEAGEVEGEEEREEEDSITSNDDRG